MECDPASSSAIIKLPHHVRSELCTTRLPYRQGRKLTAVKVYTVNEESQHLLIRGVPVLSLQKELKHLCMRYGEIKFINLVRNYSDDEELFTEVFHVSFARIQSARFAKHMIDDKSFYGGILHVCYAPELESITETRQKLQQRKHDVLKRVKAAGQISQMLSAETNRNDVEFVKHSACTNTPSVSNSYEHQSGVIRQVFIPRKRPHPSVLRDKSAPVSNDRCYEQNKTINLCPSNQQIPKRISMPDKFIPTPLKRIRFNKIQ